MAITPLVKLVKGGGMWQSADGHFTFMRHESDPVPKRWFIYEDDERDPVFLSGHTSLGDAVYAIIIELEAHGD